MFVRRVLYFSVHRYEHGSFWPNLRQSDYHYTGAGRGAGYTCNVPLNNTGMKDADYMAIWHHLLLPMALEVRFGLWCGANCGLVVVKCRKGLGYFVTIIFPVGILQLRAD